MTNAVLQMECAYLWPNMPITNAVMQVECAYLWSAPPLHGATTGALSYT